MSERDDGSRLGAGPGRRSVPGMAAQPSLVPGASLGLTLGSSAGLASVAPVSGHPEPAAVVGIVLAEAIALYVGYGALTRVVDPALRRLIASD